MIQTAAMIGMGAIGTVYGHRLFQQYGSRFRVAAGGDREERIRGNGLQLNGETFYPAVIHAASAEFETKNKIDRCPLCGIALNENGVCPKCGYKK